MGDLEKVIARFENLRETQRLLQCETIDARFNETELKEMIWLLGELKAIRERSVDDGR